MNGGLLGVLQGFTTISAVVGLGWLLADRGVLDAVAQRTLGHLAFFVASPALLLIVMAKAPVAQVFSLHLLVATVSAVLVMLIGWALARRRWHLGHSESLLAALTVGYVNSANLGIPIAVYVLGDATYAAPILLIQLLVFTPLAMVLLDADLPGAHPGVAARIRSLFANPITLGALAGLAVSLSGVRLPAVVTDPLGLVANLAIPCMLIAFGISLRLGQRPGRGRRRLATLTALKLAVQPAVAVALSLALGLRGHEVLASAVMAALPTAQNIFTYALRYDRGVDLTRDTILVTTLGSLPAVLVIALLLA